MKYAARTVTLKTFLFLSLLVSSSIVMAQIGSEAMSSASDEGTSVRPKSKTGILGKVMEMGTNKTVEGATIQLMGVMRDSESDFQIPY